MFKLNINTDNAAFSDGNCPHEIARILRKVIAQIERGEDDGYLVDSNGNRVGEFSGATLPVDDGEDE